MADDARATTRHGEDDVHSAAGRDPRVPRTLLIGYGEVGRAFAERLSQSGVPFAVVDPVAADAVPAGDIDIAAAPPADLTGFDLVLAAVPASAAVALARTYASLAGDVVYVDLSSSAPEAMVAAAAAFGDHDSLFVDAAIMGSVDLHGADTPMICAGPAAEQAATLMRAAGFAIAPMADSRAGDAGALKLLRSVVTKGIEAVAVEAYIAAAALGLTESLRDNLDDISRRSFPEFLDAVVRTHTVHAPRRASEVEAAVALLESHDLPSEVTRAVRDRFDLTAARIASEGPVRPADLAAAVAWLSGTRG